jgi:hypothetical protein
MLQPQRHLVRFYATKSFPAWNTTRHTTYASAFM